MTDITAALQVADPDEDAGVRTLSVEDLQTDATGAATQETAAASQELLSDIKDLLAADSSAVIDGGTPTSNNDAFDGGTP